MNQITGQTFDEERAFYGVRGVSLDHCAFDGPRDGESALKEAADIAAAHCHFNLRYPFWHDDGVRLSDCELSEYCRAAFWYSSHISVDSTRMHGIKALRECHDISLTNTDILSPEFGWYCQSVHMENCTAQSEYFMLRSADLSFHHVRMKGKYSFQYIENGVFEDCDFDTKDAFWHAKNVTVKNSVLRGEYFSWYSDGLTLINCRIEGTQPLCYCRNLRLIDCEMIDTDLAFEKSDVVATLRAPIVSIKNPASGSIMVPAVGEVIRDDPASAAAVTVNGDAPAPHCN